MNNISPKVVAGAGGTGLAGSLVIILLWAFHINPPTEVTAALTTVVGALVGLLTGYMTPHNVVVAQPPATP